MHKKAYLCLSLVCCLGVFSLVSARTITLESAKDNTLFWNDELPLTNGGGIGFFAGRTKGQIFQRGLLAFDLTEAVPEGSEIHSVVLNLYVSRAATFSQNVSLHRVFQDWGEGEVVAPDGEGFGGPPNDGDVTWLHTFYEDQFWQTPGGDFRAEPSATALVTGEGFFTWGTDPQLVADVQGWVDEPETNFGWILIGDEVTRASAKRFSSREDPTPAYRPQLTVNFTPPHPCKEDLKADLNHDCQVDYLDFAIVALEWLSGESD